MAFYTDRADGLLTKTQRDKISISELTRYIFSYAQSGDISLLDLESLLSRFCPTIKKNVTINDQADKEFRLKFPE